MPSRRECLLGALQANPKCPLCRNSQMVADLRAGITAAETAELPALAALDAPSMPEGQGSGGEVAAGRQAGAAPAAEDQAIVADSKLKALLKEVSVWMRAHERECSSCCRHPPVPLIPIKKHAHPIPWA